MQYLTSQHQVTPARSIYGSGAIETQILIGRDDVVTLAANDIYAHHTEAGDAPLGYDPWIRVSSTPVDYYERNLSGTQEDREIATAKQVRENLDGQIEQQRLAGNQLKIDVQRDPGLAVLMDEANANAETKLVELDGTPDEDLDTFDPNFDPQAVGAVATARSLVVQETALAADPGLTQEEQDDLAVSITAHQAVVDAGDNSATVPPVPLSVRRLVGTAGEDYGTLIARRVFSAGWWWLTFELQTERELDVSEYWLALYLETGTYLVTPQLTQVSDGVYEADTAAVNRPESDTSTAYSFTLCRGHITEEQFARVTLKAGVERQRYRARWGGNVDAETT